MIKHVTLKALWKESEKFEKENIPIELLSHLLQEDQWKDSEHSYQNFINHLSRCINASKDYPPILVKENGVLYVLDGLHRIALSFAKKDKNIDAIILPENYSNWIVIT